MFLSSPSWSWNSTTNNRYCHQLVQRKEQPILWEFFIIKNLKINKTQTNWFRIFLFSFFLFSWLKIYTLIPPTRIILLLFYYSMCVSFFPFDCVLLKFACRLFLKGSLLIPPPSVALSIVCLFEFKFNSSFHCFSLLYLSLCVCKSFIVTLKIKKVCFYIAVFSFVRMEGFWIWTWKRIKGTISVSLWITKQNSILLASECYK